jgi:hypothetical protein
MVIYIFLRITHLPQNFLISVRAAERSGRLQEISGPLRISVVVPRDKFAHNRIPERLLVVQIFHLLLVSALDQLLVVGEAPRLHPLQQFLQRIVALLQHWNVAGTESPLQDVVLDLFNVHPEEHRLHRVQQEILLQRLQQFVHDAQANLHQ